VVSEIFKGLIEVELKEGKQPLRAQAELSVAEVTGRTG